MSRPADRVLGRVDGVRKNGPRRWMARCPAHEDRSPSLSIREKDDGCVLIHCFAGCGAVDVVEAVGLDLRDLFPPEEAWSAASPTSPRQTKDRRAPRIPASDALEILELEALVVEIIASDLAAGKSLTHDLHLELALAASRISNVRRHWRASK